MSFIHDPVYVAAVLCLLVALSLRLARLPYLRLAGTPIIVILLCAIAANAGALPTATNGHPVYDGIFRYVAPVSIFILLLDVNLASLRRAGGPVLLLFFIGALATVAGMLLSWWMTQPAAQAGAAAAPLAGMYTGTYIGGSINFNAVALHYGVHQQGDLFAAATVVDNIIGTPWIVLVILLPRLLQKRWPRRTNGLQLDASGQAGAHETQSGPGVLSLAILPGIALLATWVAGRIAEQWPNIPMILVLTTIALLAAQLPAVRRLPGKHVTGLFLTLIFLGVIGTLCDIGSLVQSGPLALSLLAFAGLAVLFHGLLLFGMAALLRLDWDLACMASLTNVGGTSTALAGAEGLQRPDLLLPGILAGSLGNALGTYAGFAVAAWLGA